jgi:hypothetical protein
MRIGFFSLLSAMRGYSKKIVICKQRMRFSPDTGSVGSLILAFQPPEL